MASFTPSFPQFPPPTHRVDASESILTDVSNDIFIKAGPILHDDKLWKDYIKKAGSFDHQIIEDWNKILDVTLIFVGLMISVLASFILDYYQQFKPDPVDISNLLLVEIYKQLVHNTTAPVIDTDTILNTKLKPSDYNNAVINNAFLYSSLGLCIAASVFALAAKLWLISYGHRAQSSAGTAYDRAMKRQKAYSGVLAWKMGAVIQSLPLVLLVALVMFEFFIHNSIWSTQKAIGYAVGMLLGISLIAFGIACLAAAFIPTCPFHSSFSTLIRLIFEIPRNYIKRKIPLWVNPGPLSRKLIRILSLTIILLALGSGIAWATIERSGNYYSLVYVQVALVFASSMWEEKEKEKKEKKKEKETLDNNPQQYKLPRLTLITFLVIAPMLAAAGYFRDLKTYPIFVTLYILGMLVLFAFGFIASRMSKSMDETPEVDAIIWFLTSASTPDPELFKKAGRIASHEAGELYRPRLLTALMPLLSALITSPSEEVKPHDLEVYVSCLACLSTFETEKGNWLVLKEDARSRPDLDKDLLDKIVELAKNKSSSLGMAANNVLKSYGLDEQGKNGLELHKRQRSGESASLLTVVESVHSYEEMELHSRRKNGYGEVEGV